MPNDRVDWGVPESSPLDDLLNAARMMGVMPFVHILPDKEGVYDITTLPK